jgi:hypothetical protein
MEETYLHITEEEMLKYFKEEPINSFINYYNIGHGNNLCRGMGVSKAMLDIVNLLSQDEGLQENGVEIESFFTLEHIVAGEQNGKETLPPKHLGEILGVVIKNQSPWVVSIDYNPYKGSFGFYIPTEDDEDGKNIGYLVRSRIPLKAIIDNPKECCNLRERTAWRSANISGTIVRCQDVKEEFRDLFKQKFPLNIHEEFTILENHYTYNKNPLAFWFIPPRTYQLKFIPNPLDEEYRKEYEKEFLNYVKDKDRTQRLLYEIHLISKVFNSLKHMTVVYSSQALPQESLSHLHRDDHYDEFATHFFNFGQLVEKAGVAASIPQLNSQFDQAAHNLYNNLVILGQFYQRKLDYQPVEGKEKRNREIFNVIEGPIILDRKIQKELDSIQKSK